MEMNFVRQAISGPRQVGQSRLSSRTSSARNFSISRGYVSSDSSNLRKSKVACDGVLSPLPEAATVVKHGSRCRGWRDEGHLHFRGQILPNFSGFLGTKLTGPLRRRTAGQFINVAPRSALPGAEVESFNRSVEPLYQSWSELVSSVKNWDSVHESLDISGQSAGSGLGRVSFLAANSVPSQEAVQEELGRLEQTAGSILTKGSEFLNFVGARLGEFTLPSEKNVQEEFVKLEDSVSTVLSFGSEFVNNVTKTLGDVKLPEEVLGRLEQSAATIFSKGSEILENVTTKSGPPAQGFGTSVDFSRSPAVEQLGQSASRLVTSAGSLSAGIFSQLNHLTGDVVHLDPSGLSQSVGQLMAQFGAVLGSYYDGLGDSAVPVTVTATVLAAVAGSAVAVVSGKSSAGKVRRILVEGEDLPLSYDPVAIGSFFRRKPVDIFRRSVSIMTQCSALTISIIYDLSLGRLREKESRRAAQLVDLIARLGPTAIKIGQALSIRPDLLPVAYLEELQKLQDRVPPFSNEEAKVLIYLELGKTAQEVYSEMSESPVAAASLGQVYKGKLRETGETVAIKVQRPGVLEGISRDLFLLRILAYALKAFPMIQSDLIALLDTWALRFFDELDYVQEGKNAVQFAKNMKSLANVTVPAVYMQYTTRKVLTTQWIEGDKLSDSRAGDLLPLVSTALNCYLVQLLESGFLHADPHPGNLLRTPDGRLCVLDFGLMTQVTEDQRFALIEYISHLVNSDYAKVAQDLVNLGFVPADMEDPEKTAAVVPQLTRILGQLVQGGGVRKVNIQQVTDDLANIAKDYVFVLPPYFALILRAFSVLEGIGLEADPDYTIVDECYPYISKRLLTDDSPRTRAALKDFLYGGKEQLNIKRVEDIVAGFQSFREVMAPSAGDNGRPAQKSQVMDRTTKEALTIMFAPEGSYIQELLLTELVRSVDALSRDAVAQFWQLIAATLRIPGIPLPAPFFVPGSWPLPVPGLFFGNAPVARLSAEDEQSLDTVKRIWKLVEPGISIPSPAEVVEIVQEMVPFLFSLFPGVTTATRRFNAMLLQRLVLRFADDMDGTNSVLEWNKDPTASARHIQPFRIFSLQSPQKDKTGTSGMFQSKWDSIL